MPCIGVIINHLQLKSYITYPFYLEQSFNPDETVALEQEVRSL